MASKSASAASLGRAEASKHTMMAATARTASRAASRVNGDDPTARGATATASRTSRMRRPPASEQARDAEQRDGPPFIQSTPVHSARGSGSYSPVQMVGVEGPPITYWRPTEPQDVPRILELAEANPDLMAIFGEVDDIPSILARSVVSLSQLNALGEVVACLSLSHWPPCAALHPAASPAWLNALYELELEAAGTLLARLLVWDARYLATCARLLLHSVFVTLPALDQVVVVVPAKAPRSEVLLRLFDEELAKGFKTATNLQSVLVCLRESFIKPLSIREADCEDNEDLLRIFDQRAYRLRELYGDFYISELIANPESRKIIVAEEPKRHLQQDWEMRQHAVGLMVLNSDVNLALLNAHFSLLPFYGLRQPHLRDALNLAGWVKPRPEIAQALSAGGGAGQDTPTEPAVEEDAVSESGDGSRAAKASRMAVRAEGLAARAARLEAEALEKRRRRWSDSGALHYLSELSLTQEERDEPNDPYRLADVTWANVRADLETSSSLDTSTDSETGDEVEGPFSMRKKKKPRQKTRAYMLKTKITILPEFKGASNAFLIELFAMHELYDERLALDLLVEAFQTFPNLDYCALTVPHTYPTFPLLDHFVRVPPRPERNFHQELYVAHRAAVLGKFEVREAEPSDLQDVLLLIRTLKRDLDVVVDELQAAFGTSSTATWLRPYVACWQEQIVGVAVVSDEDDWEYMACHYDVARFADLALLDATDHGGLRVCLFSPVFEQRAGLFLRELHRLSGKTCLYFTLYADPSLWQRDTPDEDDDEEEEDDDGNPARPASAANKVCPKSLHKSVSGTADQAVPRLSLPSVLDDLLPVAPRPPPNGRHHMDADKEAAMEEGEELDVADRREPPYALFMSTPRMVVMPKASVNVRIVVVGASDAALSFLETLVFSSSEVRYNNLTLVSRHGLPGETDCAELVDAFLPHRGRYCHRELARLQLGVWVNVVHGELTKIHRSERLIEVDGKTVLPYDYLFLFCGQQFSQPQLSPDEDLPCRHYPSGKGWPAAIGAAEPSGALLSREGEVKEALPEEEESSELTTEADACSSVAETAESSADDRAAKVSDDTPSPEELPDNVFLVNSDVDVRTALMALKQVASTVDNYKIVLYGRWHCPELLSCVAGLLRWGVPARHLFIVDPEPPAKHDSRKATATCFGDEEVEQAVLAAVEGSGVSLSKGCELVDWTRATRARPDGKPDVLITHLLMKPKQGAAMEPLQALRKKDSDERLDVLAPFLIPCHALFCFHNKTIHPVTFSALVDCGLVMDGLLVIDRLGRTNDPFILAGGSLTTYQRKLNAHDMAHRHHSSLEVGRKMAESMRRMWDPLIQARAHVEERSAASSGASVRTASDSTRTTSTSRGAGRAPTTKAQSIGGAVRAVLGPYWRYAEMVPTLTAPVVLGVALPGGMHFLQVRSPGPPGPPGSPSPMTVRQSGQLTAANQPGECYCKLLLDPAGFVRGIVYFGAQPPPVSMLVAAFGQHESDLGLAGAADLAEHLADPDAMASVYDRAPGTAGERQADLDALFGFPSSKVVPAVTKALQSNNWEPLGAARRAELRLQWSESPEQRSIEQRVADLLREHGFSAHGDEVRRAVRALLETKRGLI